MIFTTRESFFKALGDEKTGYLAGEIILPQKKIGKAFVFTRSKDVVIVFRVLIWGRDEVPFSSEGYIVLDIQDAVWTDDNVFCAIWPTTIEVVKKTFQHLRCRWNI